MLIRTVPEFLRVLEHSQLLHPKVLRQIADQVAKAAAELTLEHLINSMLREKVLTMYQARRLLRGQSDGFYLGKYKLFDVLGQGGMGTVYLAEQISMRRLVALTGIPQMD